MFKKIIVFFSVLILLLPAADLQPTSVSAAEHQTLAVTPRTKGHSFHRYKRRFAYYHLSKMSKHYRYVYRQAAKAWTKAGFHFKETKKRTKTNFGLYYDPTFDTEDFDMTMGKTRTTANYKTGYIHSNRVYLNTAAFAFFNSSTKEQILTAEHELGHVLGLNHNLPTSVSVMNPYANDYPIEKCDIRGMRAIYKHRARF
jgi:predicted Zn-dependent protease